jgi:hypothetical protein
MKSGIYLRGECPPYDSIDAVNISSLLNVATSLKHFKASPRKSTRPMALGTAAHTATLEPDTFLERYALWDKHTAAGKTSPRCGAEFDAFSSENAGKEALLPKDWHGSLAIAESVRSDPEAKKVLISGHPEVTFVWTHKGTGLLCKGRIDWCDWDKRLLLTDLKTARDITPHAFFSSAARYHYHTRMAWYTDGFCQALGTTDRPDTTVIAVEPGEPHDVVVYELFDEELEEGRAEYELLMAKLRVAIDFDRWPGIGNGARMRYEIPRWAREDPEEETDTELDWSKQ